MKTTGCLFLFVLLGLGVSCKKADQAREESGDGPKSSVVEEKLEESKESESKTLGNGGLLPNQLAFLDLTAEDQKRFKDHLRIAASLFSRKRVDDTLGELEKASAVFADSPEIYNLRGSCHVELRDWDQALEDFAKAGSFSQNNPSIEFNIGEVRFVTKQWQAAADQFEKVLTLLTPEKVELSRLVEFKILLCKHRLGMAGEVKTLAGKHDENDPSPFHWYAAAALAFELMDEAKAKDMLKEAALRFPNPNDLAPWQDTLVEYGFIRPFEP